MTKLSPTQKDVLGRLCDSDGIIIRCPGGFWTLPEMPRVRGDVPEWYVITQTVRALETRGYLERMHVYAEDWKDTRKLTEAGRAVLTSVTYFRV